MKVVLKCNVPRCDVEEEFEVGDQIGGGGHFQLTHDWVVVQFKE